MTAAVATRNPVQLYAQSADDYYLKSQRYAEQVAKTKLPPRLDNVDIPCAPWPPVCLLYPKLSLGHVALVSHTQITDNKGAGMVNSILTSRSCT